MSQLTPWLPQLLLWLCIGSEFCDSTWAQDSAARPSPAATTARDQWPLTRTISSPYAFQAAAANEQHVFAVSNTHVAVHDRFSGELLAISQGEATHLNSAFLHEGRLFCAHSNYPQQPEQSEIRVFDLQTKRLEVFHDFGPSLGSLTWSVYHDGAWWCHFAFYGSENHRSYLARFDSNWQETGRWTFPRQVLSELGQYSLSGGIWLHHELLVTGHDEPVVYRLKLPESGNELVYLGTDDTQIPGQGISYDDTTGGLVGIDRSQRKILFVAPPRTRPLRLRVLSYNIHHGEGIDHVVDLARIAQVIRQANPDLVSLQEVDTGVQRTNFQAQAAELASQLEMGSTFGGNILLQGGSYGNAQLSRFPNIASENVLLPCFDQGEQRGLLVTKIQLPDQRAPLWFLSTHFDHRRDGRERLASAQRVREIVQSAGDIPMILAGDLNERRDQPALKELLKSFSISNDQELATIPVDNPLHQIDFIMIGPANRWRIIETRVLEERVASDHRPILAVLELLPESSISEPTAPLP